MRQVLDDLCSLLNEQKSILENMLKLSQEEKRIILSGEAELLEDIVRSEFKELSKLNSIEKKRVKLHELISAELELPVQGLNVSSIVQHVEPDERGIIVKLQTELTALLKQHTELNAENRELIKAHLEYSDAVLDLMVDSEDPLNNFYNNDGTAAQDKKKTTGLFDGHA